MPIEEGAICCSCQSPITGERLSRVFDNHTFTAKKINGHTFCTANPCYYEALSELAGKRTASCHCIADKNRQGATL